MSNILKKSLLEEAVVENKKQKCCICGRDINGHGNNPDPYKINGRCCNKCNTAYVIPIRMLQKNLYTKGMPEKAIKNELAKFRKNYYVLPFELLDKRQKKEIGELIESDILENRGIFVSSIKDEIEGKEIPIEPLTIEEIIQCIDTFLSTRGKTVPEWQEDIGNELIWYVPASLLCIRDALPSFIHNLDERLIKGFERSGTIVPLISIYEKMNIVRQMESPAEKHSA